MKIDLEKGPTHVTVDLPDKKLLSVIHGKEVSPLSMDQAAAVMQKGITDRRALPHRKRQSSSRMIPPGIATQKTAIIIPDDTRLWARGDLFVPAIIQALTDLGVPDEKITVIIALGTHAPIPENQFALLAGQASVSRVRICNSAGLDPSRLIEKKPWKRITSSSSAGSCTISLPGSAGAENIFCPALPDMTASSRTIPWHLTTRAGPIPWCARLSHRATRSMKT